MSFTFSVPLLSGQQLNFEIKTGEIVFVLGANGTGKSSMIQRFFAVHRQNARRISAHRQTWFETNAVQITAAQKRDSQNTVTAYDAEPVSRWRDSYANARPNLAIFDLLDAQNVRARQIAAAVDEGHIDLAKQLARADAPLKTINDLLRFSALPIQISVERFEQVFASRDGCTPYSIAELSDGERNALLIAAEVLTAPPNSLFFIDEPERHLHRSIISPLLTLLFAKRSDCAFMVSTHDVLLPIDNPSSRTLLLRSCRYNGSTASAWDADLVVTDTEIEDSLKKDILGSRRKLLFVEGEEHSLDKPIYSLLFPSASVVPKQSCRDVEHAVAGIRDAAELHWVKAFGIVDRDNRQQSDVQRLKERGVYAVPAVSVESIYYHPEVQRRVCERQAKVTGAKAELKLSDAKSRAIGAMQAHAQRLSERIVETRIRADLMTKLPRRQDIAAAQPIAVSVDVPAIVAAEKARLEAAVQANDLDFLIARYPIRETPALGGIAEALGFQSRSQYEGSVRQLLVDDSDALSFVRGLFGTLAEDIERS
ncbi:AAA family ATPase [Bradyrhizobium sp. CCBAU 25338]|uniref:AAA family ATPase n=1 Tax=Bradyrhizobium sp. CCBAU 25338 TaxID=1641877 RepID=UPI002304714A|nr:AAA family ATPase [Bradyrhizobium sp. CCBAU 25338]